MTPDDVAAIRAKHTKGHVESWYHPEPWCSHCTRPGCSTVLWPCPEVALCDALEVAWAGRGLALKIARANLSDYREMRERAERAEQEKRATAAERDMWKTSHGALGKRCQEHEARAFRAEALAAELMQDVSTEQAMTDRANAALGRVRALCDYYDGGLCRKCAAAVRAAIEGP